MSNSAEKIKMFAEYLRWHGIGRHEDAGIEYVVHPVEHINQLCDMVIEMAEALRKIENNDTIESVGLARQTILNLAKRIK